MDLKQFHSISKKILVALVGGFLLIFLLFHACANLCILRHDDGAWYSAFCHFMGSNYIVKAFEVVLLLALLVHIVVTIWLWFTNRRARGPVAYHQPSRTKTHSGSKLQVWTGILILAFLVMHFCQFYFVKMGLVQGTYMAKTEELNKCEDFKILSQSCMQYGITPEEFIESNRAQVNEVIARMEADTTMTSEMKEQQKAQIDNFMKKLDTVALYAPIVSKMSESGNAAEQAYVKGITPEAKALLAEADIDVEPDFYSMTREEFKTPLMAIIYLLFFVVLWFHMRHAFPAAFQTLGLYNYKYGNAIEVLGKIYAWFVCLVFVAVVLLVFLGL